MPTGTLTRDRCDPHGQRCAGEEPSLRSGLPSWLRFEFPRPILAGLVLFACFQGVAAARAPYDLDLPADSPVWWTLSDSLSPAGMRATFRDRAAHLDRYRRAWEAGLVQELPEQGLRRLSFYVNTEQTPELTPMWKAFDVWAGSFTQLYGREALGEQMGEYGLPAAAVDRLLRTAESHVRERESITAEIKPKQLEFVQVQRQVILILAERPSGPDGGSVVERALTAGDLEPLIEYSGRSPEKIDALYAAWKTDPGAHSAMKILPRIKRDLSAEEWNGLRRYLLRRVVPGMGPVMDFDAGVDPLANER